MAEADSLSAAHGKAASLPCQGVQCKEVHVYSPLVAIKLGSQNVQVGE